MNSLVKIELNLTGDQIARFSNLQHLFAEVCNAIVPYVVDNRCWNRVALHHMAYHHLRGAFPQMGSQMICNAIYSVCRTYRVILDSAVVPFNISKTPDQKLPMVVFLPAAHVYFDRHTLSIKKNRLSLYTLDGRVHFDVALSKEQEDYFHYQKIKEIILIMKDSVAELNFIFSSLDGVESVFGAGLPDNVVLIDSVERVDAA